MRAASERRTNLGADAETSNFTVAPSIVRRLAVGHDAANAHVTRKGGRQHVDRAQDGQQ